MSTHLLLKKQNMVKTDGWAGLCCAVLGWALK